MLHQAKRHGPSLILTFIHFLDYFHLFDYLAGEVVGMVGEVINMALENMEYLEYQ